jgi:hypothetical protein
MGDTDFSGSKSGSRQRDARNASVTPLTASADGTSSGGSQPASVGDQTMVS